MRLYLVRHGETDHNVARRIQGPLLDDPLNAKGIRQADALARRFAAEREKGLRLAAVYSSPLKRAWMTAEAVAKGAGAPAPVPVKGLTEFSWGVYLGKTETGDTLEAMKALHKQWRAGHVEAAPPEGESPAGAFRRAWADLGPLVAQHARHKDARRIDAAASASPGGDTIAWVAHGRIFKILLSRLVAGDVSKMEDFPQGNTAVSVLEHDGKGPFDSGWRVALLNDQSHFEGLGHDTAASGPKPLV